MDLERFLRTRKVSGEQRGVEVQCASMGAPTALIGDEEEEKREEEVIDRATSSYVNHVTMYENIVAATVRVHSG